MAAMRIGEGGRTGIETVDDPPADSAKSTVPPPNEPPVDGQEAAQCKTLLPAPETSTTVSALDGKRTGVGGVGLMSKAAAVGPLTPRLDTVGKLNRSLGGMTMAASWAHSEGHQQVGASLDAASLLLLPAHLRQVSDPPGEPESSESLARRWLVGGLVGTGNDLFGGPFDKFADDNGFTASLLAGLSISNAKGELSADFLYQMLTARDGPERWDQLHANFKYDRHIKDGSVRYSFGPRVGLAFGGDAGGSKTQDWFHTKSGMMTGASLYDPDPSKRLQHQYDGEDRFGITVGARGAVEVDLIEALCGPNEKLPRFITGVAAEAQWAPGATGLSFVSASASSRLEVQLGPFVPYVEYTVDQRWLHTNDKNLAQPEYFNIGQWNLSHTLEAGLRVGKFSLGAELSTNFGGSEQHVGKICVGYALPSW